MSAVFALQEFVASIAGAFDWLERASGPEFFRSCSGGRNRQQLCFNHGGETFAGFSGKLFAASNGLVGEEETFAVFHAAKVRFVRARCNAGHMATVCFRTARQFSSAWLHPF